jgi:uncharacterized phiE125 gp8 family phage protein
MLMAEHYLKQTTAPAAAPISVAEAKAHMRVDVSDDDTLIGSLIETAVAQLDGYDGTLGGRAMVTQSWTISTRYALENRIYLPVAPVQSVTSISYYDGNDANQTATVSDYYLHNFEDVAWLYPKSGKSWPSVYDRPDAFRVEFVTGYGAASAVPDDIKTALLLMVAHWYANREPVLTGTISSELPFGIDHIIAKYRLGWSG